MIAAPSGLKVKLDVAPKITAQWLQSELGNAEWLIPCSSPEEVVTMEAIRDCDEFSRLYQLTQTVSRFFYFFI